MAEKKEIKGVTTKEVLKGGKSFDKRSGTVEVVANGKGGMVKDKVYRVGIEVASILIKKSFAKAK